MLELLGRVEGRALLYTQRVALIGVVGILLIGVGTIVDVLMRFLFNQPLAGFNEIVQLGIAVAIAATFPGGAMGRVNIRMDLLLPRLGPVAIKRLECLGAAFLLVFYICLAWQFTLYADDLDSRGATTVFLGWRKAPSMYAAAALFGVCAAAQFVVFLISIRDMLIAAGERVKEGQGVTPLSDRRFSLWAIGLVLATTVAVFGIDRGILGFSDAAQQVPSALGVGLFFVMWILSLFLVPIGVSMAFVGVVGGGLLMGVDQALSVLGTEAATYLANDQLAVLPLFLLMGSFAAAAGLSTDIYDVAHAFLGHRRGGLALATIGGSAGFGALTGSSVATAATIGAAALPEMRRHGYSAGLATGAVAAGGTLGQLVPPSTALVLYAILTEESIGRLFVAAVVPAVIAVVLYMATISIVVRIYPESAPVAHERARVAEILRTCRKAWGVLLLFALVLGGIYGGVFSVTEASAVGAVGAFLFALFRGKLKGGNVWRVMGEVTRTTAMIYNLIFGAVVFSFFVGISGLPDFLTSMVNAMHLSALGAIFVLLLVFVALGTVMDSFPVMVITIPIVTPMITGMGYDLVWWGIINVCVVETGAISPPFGINIFILKGIQGGDVPLSAVYKGVLPFCVADIIKLALIVFFPALALWLPSTMFT